MEMFDANRACPACGFVPSAALLVRSRYVPVSTTGDPAIDRTCYRCGFAWEEAPLNAADPVPGSVDGFTPDRPAEAIVGGSSGTRYAIVDRDGWHCIVPTEQGVNDPAEVCRTRGAVVARKLLARLNAEPL